MKNKETLVRQVFDSVAKRYDLMNDLMSFGIHRLWKKKLLSEMQLRDNLKLIDVAGGTGDIFLEIAKRAILKNYDIEIEAIDINEEMLRLGKERAINNGMIYGANKPKINFTIANGEALPFANNSFDYYTIAFGIRNFNDPAKGVAEAYRTLKCGGKFICLEFAKPLNSIFASIYQLYSDQVIPRLGGIIAGDKASYQYLVDSIKTFPSQEQFSSIIKETGFTSVRAESLSGGIVAIYTGYKSTTTS